MAGMFASDGVFPKQVWQTRCVRCYGNRLFIIQPLRIFNTWMGDHSKYFVLKAILQEIKRLELFELVKSSGAMLLEGLKEIQVYSRSVYTIVYYYIIQSVYYSILLYTISILYYTVSYNYIYLYPVAISVIALRGRVIALYWL